jgi:hypothetical protein
MAIVPSASKLVAISDWHIISNHDKARVLDLLLTQYLLPRSRETRSRAEFRAKKMELESAKGGLQEKCLEVPLGPIKTSVTVDSEKVREVHRAKHGLP